LIDHASSGDFTGGAVVLNGNPYVNLWSDGGFYVKPVRLFPHYYYDQHQVLWYNTYSGEIAIGLFPIPYATTSTNLENGTTGQIPYQTTAGNTAFFGPGISGQILVSAGTGTPTYTNTTTIKVGFANAAGRLLADNTGSQYVGHAAQADSINPLNTGTQYVGNAAQADKLNPLNTSTQFVGLAAVANQVNSLNPATNLTVASLLVTTGTTIGQSLSVGGYPLDINGRALIDVLNTESSALIVSNYNPNLLPRIHVRGWGQNIPAGLTTTAQSGSLVIDGARGNPVSPTANQANDTLGQFNIGGFDGSNYLTTSTNGAIFSLFVSAAENFAYNGTTTTNAGTGLGIRLQPPRVWYTATSRPQVLQMTWTTSTSAPPGLTMNLGQGSDGTLAYLTDSANGNLYQGFGRTNFNFVNGVLTISNVTPTDGSPDNTSLTTNGSNIVSLSTNRRNAVSGRRNPVQANDILTQIDWFGQSVPNATSTGILTSQISSKALDNFTSTQAGSQLSISTANSGTTTLTSRLQLDDRNNYYSATNHTFQDTLGNTIFSANTTTGVTLINATETMYTWPSATGTITPSISSGTVHYMTLSGNITLNSIANAVTGSSITLIMNQPSSGGPYTLSSTMKWAAGSKTLSVSNSATDIATVFYDGTNYWATLNKGFF
jgi:hypothetical protein